MNQSSLTKRLQTASEESARKERARIVRYIRRQARKGKLTYLSDVIIRDTLLAIAREIAKDLKR